MAPPDFRLPTPSRSHSGWDSADAHRESPPKRQPHPRHRRPRRRSTGDPDAEQPDDPRKATSAPKSAASTTTVKTETAEEPYYSNCDAVRAAGKDPLHRGDPGYRTALDRDGDGVACE